MQYSVVNYKTVKENSSFRIDADFFHPEYLEIENLVGVLLKDLAVITDGDHSKFPENQKQERRYLRAKDLKNNFVSNEDPIFVSNEYFKNQRRSIIKENNILLSIMGSVGEIAITPKNFEECIANRAVSIIKNIKIDPYYLFSFLLTEYGFNQINRYKAGGVQERINLDDLGRIKIVSLSSSFQNLIHQVILKRFEFAFHSNSLYTQAEKLLLAELGLLDWKPKHELAFVKNFSDTQKAERMDAEYFQPKYEEIIEAVKKYKGGFDELRNLVKIKDKNFTPKEKELYKYIELANISSNGEINGYTENFGNELPSRARRKVQKGDLIISSIEGSLESIALITEDWKNALCSTGFFVVNSDKINSETLLVLLKTTVGQLQLKKGCKGTILTAIDKNELSKIVLPKIDPKTQEVIREKITEMYEMKKLSKSLLEIAKRGVEMAIEKDEQEAEIWIENKLTELGIEI